MNPLNPLDAELIWRIVEDLGPAAEQVTLFEDVVARPFDTSFTFGGAGGLGGEFRREANPKEPFSETWRVVTRLDVSARQKQAVHQVNAELAKLLATCHLGGRL